MRKGSLASIITVALMIILVPMGIFAQTGKIQGRVFDTYTKRALIGANVIVEGTDLGAATGPDGRYVISAVPIGEYSLTVSMMGYKKMTKKIEVYANQVTTVDFDLEETVLKGGLIVVTATKTKHLLKDVPVATSVITRREIEAANFHTAQQALRCLSGVKVNESYGWGDKGKVELLGMGEKHTLVLVDGQRVYGGHKDAVDLQAYPVEMIERIEVVKGPGSCLYGSDAMGGVINIISRSVPTKFTFSASPSFGSRNRRIYGATHGLTIGKFGYFLSYTHRESEGIEPEVDKYEEEAFQGNFQYEFTPDSKVILKPYYSSNKMKESDRKQKRYSLNSIWQWTPDKLSTLKLRGSFFHYDHRWIAFDKRTGYKNDSYEAELSYNRLIKDKHSITAGYHYHITKMDNTHIGLRADQTIHSFYIQDEITFEPFALVVGTRVDRHDKWGKEVNPKMSFLYKITEGFRIRGSIGRAFRGPSLVKLYGDNWRMGPFLVHKNPDLKPERSTGYQLGAEWRISTNLLGNLFLFQNEVEGLIDAKYARRGRPPWDLYWCNIARARTQGIELNLSSQFTDNLSGRMGYTFLDTEDKKTGKELPYKPKHTLFFEFNWKIPQLGLEINLDGNYIGKRYKDEENSQELSDYALANISITQSITRFMRVYLRIDNIFGKKGVEDAYYIDGTEFLGGIKVNY